MQPGENHVVKLPQIGGSRQSRITPVPRRYFLVGHAVYLYLFDSPWAFLSGWQAGAPRTFHHNLVPFLPEWDQHACALQRCSVAKHAGRNWRHSWQLPVAPRRLFRHRPNHKFPSPRSNPLFPYELPRTVPQPPFLRQSPRAPLQPIDRGMPHRQRVSRLKALNRNVLLHLANPYPRW